MQVRLRAPAGGGPPAGTATLYGATALVADPACVVTPDDDCLRPGPGASTLGQRAVTERVERFVVQVPGALAVGDTLWLQAEVQLGARVVWSAPAQVTVADGAADPDGDGVSNLDEALAATNPGLADTDGDGLRDGADPHPRRFGEASCDDGRDEDADHLVDCEDDDCFADPVCGEQACADGADDDGDGAIDCADDDCWGAGCESPGTTAWVTGGRMTNRWGSGDYGIPTAFGGSAVANPGRTAELRDLRGRLRHVDAAGVAHTCAWSVDAADLYQQSFDGSPRQIPGWPNPRNTRVLSSTTAAGDVHVTRTDAFDAQRGAWIFVHQDRVSRVDRAGVRVQPGCGFADDAFLPPFVGVDLRPFAHAPRPGCRTRPVGVVPGQTWYAGLNARADIIWDNYFYGSDACAADWNVVQRANDLKPAGVFGVCDDGRAPVLQGAWTGEAVGVCRP